MAKAFINDANLTNIGNAIRNQNGTTTTYLPSEMADAINALPVLDTSDGTATSGDIANGKIAYVNGEQVTGSLPDYEKAVDANDATYSEKYCLHKNFTSNIEQASFQIGNTAVSAIKLSSEATADAIIRNGQTYCHIASAGWFGDATPADVASGKTFTSSEGLKITGTATIGEGLNTSDATATASDIVDGKTAYVNGEKITGSVRYTSSVVNISNYGVNNSNGVKKLYMEYPSSGLKRVIGDGEYLQLQSPLENFGDATAADVVSGKTFTSSAGLKITGTASTSSSGGSTVKSGTTTSATISTGLSSIDYIVIYKTALSETGLIQAIYNAGTDTLNYTYCSSYSSYTKTCAVSSSTASSVIGGAFTLGLSGTSGLSSGVTYSWVAFGQA